ncbi:MAG: tetratricopeptide repeat protein [Desmonostoc vinosum HA7617-LM4]|jgi:tetratricopeptide (TPR) repeat protein|nr:tetratricopeptide repeat protein [Desmonostoc vinosum HA7617-LM4]
MNSQLLDGHYQILTVLNTGELVQTYLVEDTKIPHSKFLVQRLSPPSNNPKTLSILRHLFTSQVANLEKLTKEYDQIQKLVGYFEENEAFYLVQEFIPGNSLNEEILHGVPLKENEVINLLIEVLEILVFAHTHGIIHRDIKPANIIRRESDKKLVLTNFGGVREVITHTVDTKEYMPVEQTQGNTRYNSDIYALGIIAIAAITGLKANEIYQLKNHKKSLNGEIIWHDKTTNINQDLVRVLNKMVRLNYRKRYQYATEILDELKLITNHEYQQRKRQQKILGLISLGIFGSISISLMIWFSQLPKPPSKTQQFYQSGVDKYQSGKYQQAVEDLTQAIAADNQNAAAYNKRGDAFYRLGDFQKAQADSSQAILLNPQDANAYYDRGFSLYEMSQQKEAIADHTQAIKLDPKNPYTYYGRGLAHVKLKSYKQAIKDFNQAIALKSNYAKAYLQRGLIHRRLKLRQAAIKDFNQAIKINPKDAKAYYQRGLTQYLSNQKQAAIKDYTNAINLNPKYTEAYLKRADIYSEIGDKLEATADYNKVLQLQPKSITAYIHRGLHRFSFGDYRGAIEDYTEAIELKPNNAAAYNNRGNAYLELGNKKAANQDYTQAIAINKSYALAYYNRGIIRARVGNKKTAIGDFQTAAKLFKKQGEKDSYKDAQKEIALIQRNLSPVKAYRIKSGKREKN